ncbi:MAG: transposase [Cognatishimia sp.]|uniref:transposase n=1 Tax=Cognatishimia sp. TaxID=2211648 RepID=UPI003B8BE81E
MQEEPFQSYEQERTHWLTLYLRLPAEGVAAEFPTESICENRLEAVRWPQGPKCPNCKEKKFGYLEARKLYYCKKCPTHFSLTSGTLFHRRRLDLRVYFLLAEKLIEAEVKRLRPTGHQIKDEYQIAYATAFKLKANISNALRDAEGGLLGRCICLRELHLPPDLDRETTGHLNWLENELQQRQRQSFGC